MFRDGADVALSSFRCKKCPDPDPEYASLPFAHTPPCHWRRGRGWCEKEEEKTLSAKHLKQMYNLRALSGLWVSRVYFKHIVCLFFLLLLAHEKRTELSSFSIEYYNKQKIRCKLHLEQMPTRK